MRSEPMSEGFGSSSEGSGLVSTGSRSVSERSQARFARLGPEAGGGSRGAGGARLSRRREAP